MSSVWRSGACLRCCLLLVVGVLVLCVSGPALLWRLKKSLAVAKSAGRCPPCVCNCPPPESLLKIAPGLVNLSITAHLLPNARLDFGRDERVDDCGKHDPELKKEMEKQFVDLVSEELKLHAAVSEESKNHMNLTLVEARRVKTEYQREAEKCNEATETCEEARERSEASLIKERKITALWEKRARQLGWEGE